MTGEARIVTTSEIPDVVRWLGDTPETVMSVHRLTSDLGLASVVGLPGDYRAVVVQGALLPEEPVAFGEDAELIWSAARILTGWSAINAPAAIAGALGEVIQRDTAAEIELGPEVYFVRSGEETRARHNGAARLLTSADLPLVETATEALGMQGWRFGSASLLLELGCVAGACDDGELVSVAFTSAISARHGEIGVVTRSDHRGLGLARACAVLVTAAVEARGLVAVWSTSTDNLPSRRIAESLGFVPFSRRNYVNVLRGRSGTNHD